MVHWTISFALRRTAPHPSTSSGRGCNKILMISSLTAEKLACVRGDKKLFDGLSFRVTAGQALAVEGANGTGKTSLLRLIAGFLAPAAGRLIVKSPQGESDDAEERGKSVGWLGHLDGLKPQLTVMEQLNFFA